MHTARFHGGATLLAWIAMAGSVGWFTPTVRADYWGWDQTPSWTSSAGATVTAHLLDVQTVVDPFDDESFEVVSFTIGYTGTGVDDDRIQFSLLSPNGAPEYDTFTTDFESASVSSFAQFFPTTSGSPDKGQSITNTQSNTGDFYVEFTHTYEPGVVAEDGTVLSEMFWVHWSDSNVKIDTSTPRRRPAMVLREGTRATPAANTTVTVGDLNGPDVNGVFLRPGVVFALQSTDEWLTHVESAPGSTIRVSDNGNASIGDFDEQNVILNGDVEIGQNAFLNFNTIHQVQLYGDVSTDGGGINAEGGVRIGSPDSAADIRDDHFNPLELSLFTELGGSYNAANQAAMMQQMASEMNQAAITMSQIGAEAQKTQAQRHQILSETQTKVYELVRDSNLNRAKAQQQVNQQINQFLARSTYTADVSLFTDVVVGGAGDIERVDIVGNAEIDAFSFLRFDIAGNTPGTEHDVIAIDGELALDHFITLDLTFEDAQGDGWIPQVGDSFDLITADSINAVFFFIEAPDWEDRFMIAGVVDLNGGGQAVRAVTITIPEPATAGLLLTAVLLKRTRRAHANQKE